VTATSSSLIRDRDVIVLYPEKGGVALVDDDEVARRYSIPGRAYADFAILRGDPSDGLPGVAGVGPKKAADLIRRYGSLRAMIDAACSGPPDAEYLEKASRVVPPVADLKIAVPAGRRDRYPDDPQKVEEMAVRYGVGGSLEAAVRSPRQDAEVTYELFTSRWG